MRRAFHTGAGASNHATDLILKVAWKPSRSFRSPGCSGAGTGREEEHFDERVPDQNAAIGGPKS